MFMKGCAFAGIGVCIALDPFSETNYAILRRGNSYHRTHFISDRTGKRLITTVERPKGVKVTWKLGPEFMYVIVCTPPPLVYY